MDLNGVRYAAPAGAFYAFVGVEGLTDSLGLAKKLVTHQRVAVAPGVAFGAAGEGFLRVCFAPVGRAHRTLRDGAVARRSCVSVEATKGRQHDDDGR